MGKKNGGYTYTQIASDFSLWAEYVDPQGFMTEEWFYNASVDTKVGYMINVLGQDSNFVSNPKDKWQDWRGSNRPY